jgi:putative membrane protein
MKTCEMGWMLVFWGILLIGLVYLIYLFVRSARRPPQSGGPPELSPDRAGKPPSESPEQILKARYARGEIKREEYLRRLEDARLERGNVLCRKTGENREEKDG